MESLPQDLLLDRLAPDSVADDVADLTLAGCQGPDDLRRAVGGAPVDRPARSNAAADAGGEPAGAYLRNTTVDGFRGIGPRSTLELPPGPGLTLVAGRNGSGKSSFAEALEDLRTGDSHRWHGRSALWVEGCAPARASTSSYGRFTTQALQRPVGTQSNISASATPSG